MDEFDEMFAETPNLEKPAPAKKVKPELASLLYFCAIKDHVRCAGRGLINLEEGKTNSYAGVQARVRCSCECHEV